MRVLQNLGGIGNFSVIPDAAKPEQVIAFDTGPGNMVIDACTERLFKKPFDRDGKYAAHGKIIEKALNVALRHPFFCRKPPKTAGREEFGREFVAKFLRSFGRRAKKEDIIATATALTARSIGTALRLALNTSHEKTRRGGTGDYIVAGGGAHNKTLLEMLKREVEPLGFKLTTTDKFGLPAEAKEAVAFALLAYQTWHRQPGNMPSATGASRPAILGKIAYV